MTNCFVVCLFVLHIGIQLVGSKLYLEEIIRVRYTAKEVEGINTNDKLCITNIPNRIISVIPPVPSFDIIQNPHDFIND